MILNIDPSGNIRVGTDGSTTSAKHFAIYLAALTGHVSEVSYDETSQIKNASYNSETSVLSWLENGAQQTYSMNTPDLDVFIKSSFEYEGSVDLQQVMSKLDEIVDYVGTNGSLRNFIDGESNEIAQKIDAAQAVSSVEVNGIYDGLCSHVSGESHAVINNIHTVEAKVDAIQAGSNLSGETAKLTWLAARCQMQRLDVLASLSLSQKKIDEYVIKAPVIRPDRMPTNETLNTFVTED